jgi:hypothetical protein
MATVILPAELEMHPPNGRASVLAASVPTGPPSLESGALPGDGGWLPLQDRISRACSGEQVYETRASIQVRVHGTSSSRSIEICSPVFSQMPNRSGSS